MAEASRRQAAMGRQPDRPCLIWKNNNSSDIIIIKNNNNNKTKPKRKFYDKAHARSLSRYCEMTTRGESLRRKSRGQKQMQPPFGQAQNTKTRAEPSSQGGDLSQDGPATKTHFCPRDSLSLFFLTKADGHSYLYPSQLAPLGLSRHSPNGTLS